MKIILNHEVEIPVFSGKFYRQHFYWPDDLRLRGQYAPVQGVFIFEEGSVSAGTPLVFVLLTHLAIYKYPQSGVSMIRNKGKYTIT